MMIDVLTIDRVTNNRYGIHDVLIYVLTIESANLIVTVYMMMYSLIRSAWDQPPLAGGCISQKHL